MVGRSHLVRRRRRARLTQLQHQLLHQAALDRERGRAPTRISLFSAAA